ncbi:juvenile hormone epoxide hydrolase 2-like [Cylas formicarius]|uniref:juvenile hormone epoxide hydrolase 2-like n=1 Tax=Cylas formicarius TaxID=197179 RepID=UPI002958670E|nr:juvenile hormone epoxide hydrolase 2-like [Cylas formicarius]
MFGLIVIALLVYMFRSVWTKLTSRPLPKLIENAYWGPGNPPENPDTTIREFKINFPGTHLVDLKYRLENVRPLVPPLEGIQQQYGMNTDLLKKVIAFWIKEYNWKERETYLNQYPQFKTKIQGLDIHYLHVKPKNPGNKKVVPLLIIHGWPGSVVEFYKVIPLFTDPQNDRNFVFEVIAPNIPGYGFSQAAAKPGLGAAQMATIFRNFMNRLGYDKFYCQGGDFGAIILQYLCLYYPESVLGYHTNMAILGTASRLKTILGVIRPSWIVKPEHHNRVYPLWQHFQSTMRETGYLHLQATKPDTLGVGVTDSPAGLAAYILEKFTSGTNITWQKREDGGLDEKFTYTELLDNVMIYWLTGTATTSFRLYSETFNRSHGFLNSLGNPIEVPTAIARFKYDFYVADGVVRDVFKNLVQLNDFDGGHFAAWEEPRVFAKDVFDAVEKFEKIDKKRQ